MSNVKNIAVVGSLITLYRGDPVEGHFRVDAATAGNERVYAFKPKNGLAHIINASAASRLVMGLARDLYEAGHITPGEIADHMLRETED